MNRVHPIIQTGNENNPNTHPNEPTPGVSTPIFYVSSASLREVSFRSWTFSYSPLSKDHSKPTTSTNPQTISQGLVSNKNFEQPLEPFSRSFDHLTK